MTKKPAVGGGSCAKTDEVSAKTAAAMNEYCMMKIGFLEKSVVNTKIQR